MFVSQIFTIKNKIRDGILINGSPATISVIGESELFATPNIAKISLSVLTEEKTVEKATKKNNEKMNSIIKFIKSQNIQDKDIKTVNYYVNPRYEYRDNNETSIFPPKSSTRILIGYEITQTLEVKIRNLDNSGAIIEGAISLGTNQVGDLQFIFDDETILKDKAKNEAIKNAQEKAKILANQLGVKLTRIIDYNDQSSPIYTKRLELESVAYGIGEKDNIAAPSIEPGENKITSRVIITYEIR
ncbi:MAG: SIMPL domain-containing protein [Patescibacteria group bacterium]